MIFFKTKKEKMKEEAERAENEKQEKAHKEKAMLRRKQEEEILLKMDAEARKTLQGENKDKYAMARVLGLDRQAEIARIEGLTGTNFIDLEEQRWILEKAIVTKLGYAVGDDSCCPELGEAIHSPVRDFPGKIPYGALIRYQELKDKFDEIRILHFDLGSDPIMYGTKAWRGEDLCFLIRMWE